MTMNRNTIHLASQSEIFTRLETIVEEAYDLIQTLREPQNYEEWFTPKFKHR